MQIYLMQHGQSLSEEKDPEKSLSPEGEAQVKTSGQAIQKMGLKFDVIIASTKKRAKQTAEIVAQAIDYPREAIQVTDDITPNAPPETSMQFLEQFSDKKSVFLAGHLPSLAKITALLTGGLVKFRNGGLVRIDVDAGSGELIFYLRPEHLKLVSDTA